MKVLLRSLFVLLLLGSTAAVRAQEPVSTSMIAGMQPKEGTLTIRSDQTNGMITFFGADKANIFTDDGKPYLLQNLKLGTKVTVQYAARQDRWYISKIIVPAAMAVEEPAGSAPAGGGAPAAAGSARGPAAQGQGQLQINQVPQVNVSPKVHSNSATDGDRTTSPGSGTAATDRDLTTAPASPAVRVEPVRVAK